MSMIKPISFLMILLTGLLSFAKANQNFQSQVYDSALAYGRSAPEALEASLTIDKTLAFQIYLTLSTPDYYTFHYQAMDAAQQLQTYFSFKVYLTLRTPAYHQSHEQALHSAEALLSERAVQVYLHLLINGAAQDKALNIAKQIER